jgi:hypothetical protein
VVASLINDFLVVWAKPERNRRVADLGKSRAWTGMQRRRLPGAQQIRNRTCVCKQDGCRHRRWPARPQVRTRKEGLVFNTTCITDIWVVWFKIVALDRYDLIELLYISLSQNKFRRFFNWLIIRISHPLLLLLTNISCYNFNI